MSELQRCGYNPYAGVWLSADPEYARPRPIERAFVMPGEADMVTAQRTRDDVLRELSRLTHRAGRMTVASLGYEPTHGEIDALLEELDRIDGRIQS